VTNDDFHFRRLENEASERRWFWSELLHTLLLNGITRSWREIYELIFHRGRYVRRNYPDDDNE